MLVIHIRTLCNLYNNSSQDVPLAIGMTVLRWKTTGIVCCSLTLKTSRGCLKPYQRSSLIFTTETYVMVKQDCKEQLWCEYKNLHDVLPNLIVTVTKIYLEWMLSLGLHIHSVRLAYQVITANQPAVLFSHQISIRHQPPGSQYFSLTTNQHQPPAKASIMFSLTCCTRKMFWLPYKLFVFN